MPSPAGIHRNANESSPQREAAGTRVFVHMWQREPQVCRGHGRVLVKVKAWAPRRKRGNLVLARPTVNWGRTAGFLCHVADVLIGEGHLAGAGPCSPSRLYEGGARVVSRVRLPLVNGLSPFRPLWHRAADRVASTQHEFTSHSSRSLRSECQPGREDLTADFCTVTWWKEQGVFRGLFMETLTRSPPKTPPPITVTLGIEISTQGCPGDTLRAEHSVPPTLTENGILTGHPAAQLQLWSSQVAGSSGLRSLAAGSAHRARVLFLCRSPGLPSRGCSFHTQRVWGPAGSSGYRASPEPRLKTRGWLQPRTHLLVSDLHGWFVCTLQNRPDDLKNVTCEGLACFLSHPPPGWGETTRVTLDHVQSLLELWSFFKPCCGSTMAVKLTPEGPWENSHTGEHIGHWEGALSWSSASGSPYRLLV